MCTLHMLWAFLLLLLGVIATTENGFASLSCIGGSIYISAHPVDVLLYQNPDLFHDLYVFKCVTTIVFTSGDHAVSGESLLSMEHGLGQAYSQMIGVPVHKSSPMPNNTRVQVGEYEVDIWSPRKVPNVQIIYLRLPDGGHVGQGYDAYNRESLRKLYAKEIDSITTTDKNATYTLEKLKDLISTILYVREANDIKMLHHKGSLPENETDTDSDHADHTIAAKLVMEIIEKEEITAKVQVYTGSVIRSFDANLEKKTRDYEKKAQAYFRYAEFDKHVCDSFEACEDLVNSRDDEVVDLDTKYVAQYLRREYYVT